ncbi:MAG: starch-binding protein, partial [Oscillospiraceae bacterium]|nr:starch-binding protein [Oscillospiraceae bacterium]
MLDDTGGTAFTNYTEYMSITDNRWSDKVRENVINSGSAGNFYHSYDNGVSADKLVLWAESHDTYGNDDGASKYDSTQNINKTWALIAARQDAMALYLARPSSMSNKLGTASTNTGWDWSEVVAVNKFHNDFVGQSEYVSNANGFAYVERGDSGIVIVNVGSSSTSVNLPVYQMANGTYTDQVSGSTYTVSNGKITGNLTNGCGYAVIYNSCSHSWVAGTTTAATCTSDGSVNYTCSKCGDTKTEVISATGHSYVSGNCSVCGAAQPADHVLYYNNTSSWSTVYVYYWSDSNTSMVAWPGKTMTSVGDGVYTYTVPADATYVIFNNGSGGTGYQTADLTIPSDADYYSNGTWTTYATCTHSYTAKVTTAATCTTAGVKTYTCGSCGDSYTESIAALGHSYVSGVCTNCGENEPCTSHSWNAGSVTTAATCTKTGVKTYTCSNCGNTKTETISALGHNYVNGTCSRCGDSESKDTMTIYFQNNWMWSEIMLHYWGSSIASDTVWRGVEMEYYDADEHYDIYALEIPSDVAGIVISGIRDDGSGNTDQTPDITSGMYDGICYYMKWDDVNSENAIGYEDIDVMIPPAECSHSYTSKVTAPTCTEAGYTTYTCTVCGDSYTEAGESALGHEAYTYAYADGVHTLTCTVCGEATTMTATDSKQFKINSAAPVLSDDIVLKYRVTVPAGFENAYMVFELNGEKLVVTDYTVESDGKLCFAFPGLNPQKM